MLDVKKLTKSAEECLEWLYESPGTNGPNGIDCSGLFVKMFRDQGASIYHGSNSIYHDYCYDQKVIVGTGRLEEGMAVFKRKNWSDADKGNKWYDKEPGNLSHIGYVASANPLKIIHASSEAGKVIIDDKIGKWAYSAKLKDANYGDEPDSGSDERGDQKPTAQFVKVYAENGKVVHMRQLPTRTCNIYDDLEPGTVVELTGKTKIVSGNEWSQVNYLKRTGWWIMSQFLIPANDEIDPDNEFSGPCTVVLEGISEKLAMQIKAEYPMADVSYG